ncbi:MAG: hypothetical protein ACHQ53_15245, partial [Polyangiales bacterium]
LLCGVRPELRHGMRGFGLEAVIGAENVFATEPGVFASAKRALGRARGLSGPSLALRLLGCAAAPPHTATPSRELVVDDGTVVTGRAPRSGDDLPLLPRALAETSPAFQKGYAAAEPLLRTPGPVSPADDDQATYDAWLTSTLMPWLDARGHEVESALRPLSEVTQGPPNERVVAAALAGLIYVRVHDQLLQVPAPPAVRVDEKLLRIYQDQVNETSATFVENATRALRACAVSAAAEREPIYGPWLELCQRQLAAIEQQQKAASALHAQVVAEREAEAAAGQGAEDGAASEQTGAPAPSDAGVAPAAEPAAR